MSTAKLIGNLISGQSGGVSLGGEGFTTLSITPGMGQRDGPCGDNANGGAGHEEKDWKELVHGCFTSATRLIVHCMNCLTCGVPIARAFLRASANNSLL